MSAQANHAAHTPGPWQYVEEKLVTDMRTACICTIHPYCGPGKEPGQYKANARLIAAAPELLAALKVMLGMAGAHNIDLDNKLNLAAIEKAIAAIAKAEGRE